MGHGVPPILQSLAHGIKPSLSVDVETQMPGDMFTQMRALHAIQRMRAVNAAHGTDVKKQSISNSPRTLISFLPCG